MSIDATLEDTERKSKQSQVQRVATDEVHDFIDQKLNGGLFSAYVTSIISKCLKVDTIRQLLLLPESAFISLTELNSSEREQVLDRFQNEFDDFELTWNTCYCRILTIRMQELLECHITECGISVRTAEQLEKCLQIETLQELLNLRDLSIIRGVPNLGAASIREICAALKSNGFHMAPGTRYVMEQDTPQYKVQQAQLR